MRSLQTEVLRCLWKWPETKKAEIIRLAMGGKADPVEQAEVVSCLAVLT